MRRASTLVFVGSAAGFAVTLLLTPVISRLYDPSAYGEFATITAVVSVFTGVSTMRLEALAQKAADEDAGRALLRLAMRVSIAVSVLATVGGLFAVFVLGANLWWASVGALIFAATLQLIGAAVLTRQARYRDLGIANFAQGAVLGVAQTAFGVLWGGLGSLLVGFGAARLAWIRPTLALRSREHADLARTWLTHRRTAVTAGTSALVNSVSGQMLVLLSTVLFGKASIGILAMAVRVLVTPLSLISQAVATASVGEVGATLRRGDRAAARSIVRRGILEQAALGAVPCAIALVLAPFIAPWVLGHQWDGVGSLLAALSVGAWAQFAVSPFSQLMNLSGHSKELLRWDVTRFVVVVLSLAVPGFVFDGSITQSIWCYSVGQCFVYGLLAWQLPRALESAHLDASPATEEHP